MWGVLLRGNTIIVRLHNIIVRDIIVKEHNINLR